MNLILMQSDEAVIESSEQKLKLSVQPETDAAEVARQAAIILANRATIKENWEKLARLDQWLLTLKARERRQGARRSTPARRPELVRV